jgi:peroxiredoxin
MSRALAALLVPAALLISGCASDSAQVTTSGSNSSSSTTAATNSKNTLGVPVGTRIAEATLYDQAGNPVQLSSLYASGPIIVTFYRGNWCPYCNTALASWQDRIDEVNALGATFVALTPEKPSETVTTIDKNDLTYRVLSDANREAANAFDVNFALAGSTVKKYKGYGIDLAQSNADAQWELPHPGTFIVDQTGVVRYAHVEENYRDAGRATPSEVIAALRAL